MATKRILQQDPEYDDIPPEIQEKRIKLLEDNVRRQTEKKIEAIIKSNFEPEIAKKHQEIDSIDETLHEARCMLDRLRACAITKYYANMVQEQVPNEQTSSYIHPTVKKYLGKSPKHMECSPIIKQESSSRIGNEAIASSAEAHKFQFNNQMQLNCASAKVTNFNQSPLKKGEEISTRAPRFKRKCKIVIGNISKFIPVWQRDGSDQSTHKWMVYVRGDRNNPNIESFVKKVRFLLHPSYRPSDIVEISNPPFHLIKRGWGEFPVRVQLHFHDARNKPVDIIHNLKLDKTFTGLQTLGGETVVELQLFKPDEAKSSVMNGPFSFAASAPQYTQTSSESNSNPISCNGSISSDSFTQEQDLNSNVHIIKKEPDSLVMNIKLSKPVPSEQTSNVNNHKVILPASDSATSSSLAEATKSSNSGDTNKSSDSVGTNSDKRIVPKIVISNNRVTTKATTIKPFTIVNGLNTTVVRCTDKEGKVLLVPPSSLTFKTPLNKLKNKSMQPNSFNNAPATEAKVTNSVPSYYVKVVPNQDGGKNQIYLIPLTDKKTENAAVKSPSGIKESSEEPDVSDKSKLLMNVAEIFKKTPELLYRFELDNIKLEYCKTFEDLLKRVCRIFPLVKEGLNPTVLTFCARTVEEFHTWNIGKQKASEWRRAGKVRQEIIKILKKKGCTHITPDSVWSRSSIMTWCRKNGFVPMATEKVTPLPEPKWSGVELCSFTNPDDMISSLTEEKYTPVVIDDHEEEIDVVNIAENKSNKPSTTVEEETCSLPHLSDCSLFIKHAASQLGIDIKPVELEPKICFPAIEEMLLSAVKQFATDLVGESLNEGFNRLGGKICPEEITASDIYSAAKNNSKFDFITNSCLGLPKSLAENT